MSESTPPNESLEAGHDPRRQSRPTRAWLSLVGSGLVLVLLIIFIVQNTQRVKVSFLGWNWHAPLAVALLVSAAAAIIVTAIAGTLRVVRRRRRVRRDTKRH